MAAFGFKTWLSSWGKYIAGNAIAPFEPMEPVVVERLLDFSKVGHGDTLVDLGSGDGRILIGAAKRGANTIGYELNDELIKTALENINNEGLSSRCRIEKVDARTADLSKATHVTIYLSEKGNSTLLPLFRKQWETRPEMKVLSFLFPIPELKPIEVTQTDGIDINLYTGVSKVVPEGEIQRSII